MNARSAIRKPVLAAFVASNLLFALSTLAADIKGQVLGGGAPIAQSTVTLMGGERRRTQAARPDKEAMMKADLIISGPARRTPAFIW